MRDPSGASSSPPVHAEASCPSTTAMRRDADGSPVMGGVSTSTVQVGLMVVGGRGGRGGGLMGVLRVGGVGPAGGGWRERGEMKGRERGTVEKIEQEGWREEFKLRYMGEF